MNLESLLADLKKIEADIGMNLQRSPPTNFMGFNIIQHPLLAEMDYRTEHYRGCGGYKFRWNIRKERRVPCHKVLMFPSDGLMFGSPETMMMIRNVIP